MKRRLWLGALLALSTLVGHAQAFTHIVADKDTLASIAERYYGRIQFEKLLVAANDLDARGGSPIVRGMRLEVPALGHRVVRNPADIGDTVLRTVKEAGIGAGTGAS